MSKIKGTDIVNLKRLLKEKGNFMEEKFLSKMDLEVLDLYQNIMNTTWAPVDKMLKIYESAAELFFPNDPDRLIKIGRLAAEKSFSGVYKIFIRNTDLESILNRIGMIWNAYHVKGKITAYKGQNCALDLVVSDYPELPRNMRLIINGHFSILLELTGAKNVVVTNLDSNPNAWCWHIVWE